MDRASVKGESVWVSFDQAADKGHQGKVHCVSDGVYSVTRKDGGTFYFHYTKVVVLFSGKSPVDGTSATKEVN